MFTVVRRAQHVATHNKAINTVRVSAVCVTIIVYIDCLDTSYIVLISELVSFYVWLDTTFACFNSVTCVD